MKKKYLLMLMKAMTCDFFPAPPVPNSQTFNETRHIQVWMDGADH